MKRTKKLAALLLSLTLVTPLAFLYACKDSPTTDSTSQTIVESLTPDSDTTQEDPLDSVDSAQSSEEDFEESATPSTSSSSSAVSSAPTSSSQKPSVEDSAAPTAKTAQYIRLTGDSVNVRSGAGTEYSVLGSAEKGSVYAVIGKSGNWYKTYYKNKTAYVYASYATVFTLEKSKDTDVENVVSEGYKLLGVPYVYGAVRFHDGNGKLLAGFTAQKFDCSSLVQYVFYKGANELLDVNTRTQVKQGKYVAKSDLKRGDCIFFTNESRQYNTGIERIGHVAIYLGDNYILHTASDYARIEKISAQRWKFYVEARRFL